MTVKIICDTSADLNLENDQTLYAEYNVDFVPMQVMFGTEEFKEHVNIKPSEFYEKLLTTKDHPTTSQSTQADLLAAYEKNCTKYDEIISIHISGEISGAVNNAKMAKKMYDKNHPDGAKVYVFDSRTASTPFGLIVIKAAQLAKKGVDAAAIIKELDDWRVKDEQFYFTVGDLRWLFDGGRLSRAKYMLGSMLSKSPVITLIDGKIEVVKSVTGFENAVFELIEMSIKDIGEDPKNLTLHITQAAFYEESQKFAKQILEKYPGMKMGKIFTMGGVIAAHTGPGTIAPILTRNFEY